MKPTLQQANQVLNLISQKDPSEKQLQALFASGLLSDLLDADTSRTDREKFRELLGLNMIAIGVSDISDLQPPYAGWKVIKQAAIPIGTVTLKLTEFLEKGETVEGEEMLKRAVTHFFMFGLRHANALLAKADRIPEKWRQYCCVFPGTICEDPSGIQRVPCLRFGRRWYLVWIELNRTWGRGDCLVVCK
ncbi:MAG: hypothetical protein Q7S73_00180 [bacterium]|nr:hypothetical protein [bacterium]